VQFVRFLLIGLKSTFSASSAESGSCRFDICNATNCKRSLYIHHNWSAFQFL